MEIKKKRNLHLLSFLAITVGSLAIIGWILDIAVLKSVYPGLPPMRFNPALVLISLGISLYLLVAEKLKLLLRALCILIAAYGMACIYQYITGVQLGIDEFFIKD